MRPPIDPCNWQIEDWVLVVHALCYYATSETATGEEYEHAHALVDVIAEHKGANGSELLLPIES